ncbi:MAG: hypothetical protein WBD10_15840 [Acidobacteriaceae bacterium]
MTYRFALLIVGAAAFVQFSFAGGHPRQAADSQTAANLPVAPGAASALPPLPQGNPTVIGGVIRSVDSVRDQIKLTVFGGKSMNILFDPRTRIYRDGKRVSLRDMRPDDHASVETVLDGTEIFAMSVHMLSQAPQGECQGQVVDYDPSKGELTVSTALSQEPIKLVVPPSARVFRKGQSKYVAARSSAPALVSGDLVSVTFTSGGDGRGVANEVAILASPGSAFVFSGNIAVLDLHSGLLVLRDASDKTTYRLHFNPLMFPMTKFHEGDHVRVTAKFDGSRYEASSINAS